MLFIFMSVGVFSLLSLFQTNQILSHIIQRVQEDVKLQDGKWDTSLYNADPQLPGVAPLYILASDGYVIERWKPITGFLDASDFKHLLSFTTIQTIQTGTNQDWRIFSRPIEKDGIKLGVITVSYFHPTTQDLSNIDKELLFAAETISNQITIEQETIFVREFDPRNIPFQISYQIVNSYNKIILKSNNSNSIDRLPNFIDPSYIAEQLRAPSFKLFKDQKNNEFFLLKSSALLNESGHTIGVIVAGVSIDKMIDLIIMYLLIMSLFGFMIIPTVTVFRYCQTQRQQHKKNDLFSLSFDKKNSIIFINDKKIPIAFATNQYYLCKSIFDNPNKRWEADELIDKFGEESHQNSWRKVYDAMNLINKKVASELNQKLIVLDSKTYRLNPNLIPHLNSPHH